MSAIDDVVNKIRIPVEFARRESYRHLGQIKNFEMTIAGYLQEMEAALTQNEAGLADRALFYRQFIRAMGECLKDFDQVGKEQKMAALEESRRLLEKLLPSVVPLFDTPTSTKAAFTINAVTVRKNQQRLALPIETIPGVGPKTAGALHKKGLHTLSDLLFFLPRAYQDRRQIQSIASSINGAKATIVGKIVSSGKKFYGRRPVFEAVVDDGSGKLAAKWFRGNERYLRAGFRLGTRIIMSGQINAYFSGKEMIHPDHEIIGEDNENMIHFKRIVPIYSETEGLYQKTVRRVIFGLLENSATYLLSPIPEEIIRKRQLPPLPEAVKHSHFPPDQYDLELCHRAASPAHKRLIYEEFFFFHLGMAMKRAGRLSEDGLLFKTGGEMTAPFLAGLPFPLTKAQERVIAEIEGDLSSGRSMHRLLQGDVGSGKTVVAAATLITACNSGYQAALMAPTELLADQHYRTITAWCKPLGLEVVLLTGRTAGRSRQEILEKIAAGDARIIIGTHAVIEEKVNFARLGLVVIDEQHRFGVIQRSAIRAKGNNPHVLVMTATPIPRTLAMTFYGDLDVSIIDELPPGKKKIRTRVFTENDRSAVYQTIAREIAKGNQVFIVYPLVEESESLDLKDATTMANYLQQEIFPHLRVGLIHGRLKSKEKEEVMTLFHEGRIHILVSTTVIEVGIDVPEASVMVIEHAERFGLSQLHQLRGRVGRGDKPASCLLVTRTGLSAEALKRMRIMEKSEDGFAIAEEDLAIRGPGEFMGTRQSGLPDFQIGNIVRDVHILMDAKEDAELLIATDPGLREMRHEAVREMMIIKWKDRLNLLKTG